MPSRKTHISKSVIWVCAIILFYLIISYFRVLMSSNYHYILKINNEDIGVLHYFDFLWNQGRLIKWIYILTSILVIWANIQKVCKIFSIVNVILITFFYYLEIFFPPFNKSDIQTSSLFSVYEFNLLWLQLPFMFVFIVGLFYTTSGSQIFKKDK